MKKKSLVRSAGFITLLFVLWLSTMQPVLADDRELLKALWNDYYGNLTLPSDPSVFSWERLAKAQPDECFYGIGDTNNRLSFYNNYLDPAGPKDLTLSEITACKSKGHPKVNQAYVWGLAKWGDNLWFGTVANLLCQVLQGVGMMSGLPPDPMINSSWVCEMGENGNVDTRPPRIFMYNTKAKTLTDKTQAVLDTAGKDLLLATTGLRSAGAHKGVVFLGGLTLTAGPCYGGYCTSVTIFAFNGESGEYLGAKNYPKYSNIRQWRVINKELYTGVGTGGGGLGGASKGQILRWIGSLADPFKFETVGEIEGDPAYLAEHKKHIFVSTWGGPETSGGMELYMSPAFGSDQKLTEADKKAWTVVWKISDYEVERSAFYFGGALASYGAYLHWGTMTIPGIGLSDFIRRYGPPADELGTAAAFLGTYRPTHIFRGKDFDTKKPKIELLYGLSHLPKYDGSKWTIVPNRMGQAPKYGLAGINNFFNNYTWWMELYHGRLFVGTMDFLYVAGGVLESMEINLPEEIKDFAHHFSGADLYSFTSLDTPAWPVSISGLGNYTNYGIRTMVADDFLYIGSANAMNLMTDPEDDKPEGGWELLKLRIEDDFFALGTTE